jgi:hypothetical protein
LPISQAALQSVSKNQEAIMRTKFLLIPILALIAIGAVFAQELVGIDMFRGCTSAQAQGALDLMSEWLILETADQLVEEMQARTVEFDVALYNFYIVRQSYFVEVKPNLPECATVLLFDIAFTEWLTNTTLNLSLIALESADGERFEDWTAMVDNTQDVAPAWYRNYMFNRSTLETVADLDD